MAEYDPVGILRVLHDHRVRFVVIGGVAARLQGAPLITQDLDVTPAADRANLRALAEALTALGARLRTPKEPDGVSFPITAEMLAAADAWTLITSRGDLDLAFTPDGTGGYRDLAASSDMLQVSDDPPLRVSVASLADVIRSKEAAGRAKDRAAMPLLRQTLEEVERANGPS